MSKNNNLTDFVKSLANSIRAKSDFPQMINPQDFDSWIAQTAAYRKLGTHDFGSLTSNRKYISFNINGAWPEFNVNNDEAYGGLSGITQNCGIVYLFLIRMRVTGLPMKLKIDDYAMHAFYGETTLSQNDGEQYISFGYFDNPATMVETGEGFMPVPDIGISAVSELPEGTSVAVAVDVYRLEIGHPSIGYNPYETTTGKGNGAI